VIWDDEVIEKLDGKELLRVNGFSLEKFFIKKNSKLKHLQNCYVVTHERKM